MVYHVIMSSLFALAVIAIRAAFGSRLSRRLIYSLWILVFVRFVVPVSLFSLNVLPARDGAAVTAETQAFFENARGTQFSATPDNSDEYSVSAPGSAARQQPNGAFSATQTRIWPLHIIWACGSGIMLVWIVSSYCVTYYRLNKRKEFFDEYFDGQNWVTVYISPAAPQACAFGIKPSIYISPSDADSDDVELVLMHERAHVRQYDHLRLLARKLLLAAFWWNPVVWAYNLLAARDSELACDCAAVEKLSKPKRIKYARAILRSAAAFAAVGAPMGGKPVKKRISTIIAKKKNSALLTVLACSLALSSLAFSAAAIERAAPPPVTADIGSDEFARLIEDGEGKLRWPAEYLPQDFPVPEYDEIYSVARTGDELHIIMLGAYSQKEMIDAIESGGVYNMQEAQQANWFAAHIDVMRYSADKFAQALTDSDNFAALPNDDGSCAVERFATCEGGIVSIYESGWNCKWLNDALCASGDRNYAWEIVYTYAYGKVIAPDADGAGES